MPYLDQIVNSINQQWRTAFGCLTDEQVRLLGIAETVLDVADDKEAQRVIHYPAVVNNDGEATMIDVDDGYGLTIYHKLESSTHGTQKAGYGDDKGEVVEVANLAAMVIGFRHILQKPAHQLA